MSKIMRELYAEARAERGGWAVEGEEPPEAALVPVPSCECCRCKAVLGRIRSRVVNGGITRAELLSALEASEARMLEEMKRLFARRSDS